ncbi:MAG: UDP-N-acetylmuramoyl-L-alanyl-D-glutamate--2,6-diaminopimelate ligase [Phycisphaeraceae bacterium]|nr:UDP-N-acetylmuramoyl-L-alanyl-D-glutamate--2,6-diaminopimelate ligase [Phycisphaeraceae bacterium]
MIKFSRRQGVMKPEQGMTLSELTAGLHVRLSRGDGQTVVSDLVDDSRQASVGCAFVARPGSQADGRRYVEDAIRRGAAAVIEADQMSVVGELAERFFGRPGSRLKLIGVTGTKGKSTICFLIQHLLKAAGMPCGLIGTVIIDDGADRRPAELTTPGPIDFSRYLARMVANGCQAAACEVSSHALHQGRTSHLRFTSAVFTNLTGDHLDYHGTMQEYAEAKAKLFDALDADACAVINRDDAYAKRMARGCKAPVVWTTVGGMTDGGASSAAKRLAGELARPYCLAAIHELTGERSEVTFIGPWGAVDAALPLVGKHNVSNALQAIAASHSITDVSSILPQALAACPQVPGRLERVEVQGRTDLPVVFVDYAHTHDALKNVLEALRPSVRGRLICMFGCGGDRDRSKRPKMAAVACELADVVIVTSDNPRREDPDAIIADIMQGAAGKSVIVQRDRAAAIRQAIEMAKADDTVLLAGKGHEDYQIIADSAAAGGTRKIHFDDREHAAAALAKWGRMDHG